MKVQVRTWEELDSTERAVVLARAQSDIAEVLPAVETVCRAVRDEGDAALRRFTRDFDGIDLGDRPLVVPAEEIEAAGDRLSEAVRAALEYAVENIRRFHSSQTGETNAVVEVREGLLAWEKTTPIESAGLYVPRGRGSFPSMLYMLAVPARLAGVPRITVTTPPDPDGSVDPAVLYAARLCGVHAVVRVGGAQAVAALAYGTESVTAVRKVVGPGSAYVAAAKRIVADRVDTGLPAGPSESIVLADESADPRVVALDLMIEAEHGSDSSAILATASPELGGAVARHVEALRQDVPEPRRTFLRDVFEGYGGVLLFQDETAALDFVNEFAPEHLLLHTREPRATLEHITNAGEILLGPHSAFSLANYAAGANAVLPTGGWARTYSPVSVHDFQKRSSVVEISQNAYAAMRHHVTAFSGGFVDNKTTLILVLH